MELMSQGGRITLVDLTPILNLDFNHIETAARTLTQKKKTIIELGGQLITSWYLDGVVEEINESLQESGSIAIVSLAQKFSLPADFMRTTIEQRLGTSLINGYIEDGQLYTESFLQLHTSRTRGIFRGLTKPTTLRSIIQRFGLMENRVFKEVSNMIKDGVLSGTLKGGDDRAIYTPQLFVTGQQNGADTFFTSNGYIDLKMLERLSIANPKAFIATRYPTSLQLSSLALSDGLVSGAILSCEDAGTSHLYAHLPSILPPILNRSEVEQVLTHALNVVMKNQPDLKLLSQPIGQVWCVSTPFKDACQDYALKQLNKSLDEEELKLAEEKEAALENAAIVASLPTSSSAVPKKKASPVSDSEEEDGQDSNNKRSSKTKASKKGKKGDESEEDVAPSKSKAKKRGGKRGGDSDSEEDEAPIVVPTKSKSKSKSSSSSSASSTSAPLTKDRITKWLKQGWSRIIALAQSGNEEIQSADGITDENTEELMVALTTIVQPACMAVHKTRLAARAAAAAAAAAAHSSSSSSTSSSSLGPASEQILRRQHIETFRTAIQEQYESILLYSHAIDHIAGRNANADDKSATSSLRSDKTLIGHLESHLSKTLIGGLVDLLLRSEAYTSLTLQQQNHIHGLDNLVTLSQIQDEPTATTAATTSKDPSPPKPKYDLNRTPLTQKERETIIAALNKRLSDPFKSLIEAINKEPSVFLERFDASTKLLDLRVKKFDKKMERSSIFTLRKSLMVSLANETRPTTLIHLTILLLFAKVHGIVVHAPAKVLPTMRRMLKTDMQPIAYAKLRRYNQLVMRALRGETAAQEDGGSIGGGGGVASDSEDEAADEGLSKDQQVSSMSLADVEAELKAGIEQIRAFGMDPATAVKPTK